VTTGVFGEVGLLHGFFDRSLQHLSIGMMTPCFAGTGIDRPFSRWKDVLPSPFHTGPWVFAFQGIRQIDLTESLCEVQLK
jgi:hypothetical protein